MAVNEHVVVPNRRLGKRKPLGKKRLPLGRFLTGVVPPVPRTADYFTQVRDWGLYRNDEFGVCGPTSVANSRKLTTLYLTGKEVSPTQDDVFDLYRRSGNPRFDPNTGADDNGVYMQDMLSSVVTTGIGGVKALGFASVDVDDIEEIRAAIAIFGFLLLGTDLKEAQQSQTNARLWDYVSGSGEWGGHAVLTGRYSDSPSDPADRTGIITWAEVVDITDSFLSRQVDEAWVVIWPEHLRDKTFLEGVNLHAFAAAYTDLTGRKFPAPIPPVPSPDPAPAPGPPPTPSADGGANFRVTDPRLVARITKAAARSSLTLDEWATHHFQTYFK